jgi:hypothetical protein
MLTRAACSLLPVLWAAGCGSNPAGPANTGPTETSGEIIYSKFRDLAGNVAPILAEGGGFDAKEVDSPEGVVDGGRVAHDKYMLYYEAEDPGGQSTIGLVTANEEDFQITTIGRTQVIGPGPGGSAWEAGATDPTVIVDKRAGEASRRYKMWFEGRSGGGGATSRIVYATSADGVNWSGFTACNGLNPSFASIRVADPAVELDGTTYKMWFEGVNSQIAGGGDGPGVIGYAESADGINWTVRDGSGNTGAAAGPVFTTGASDGFDAYSVGSPSVVVDTLLPAGTLGRYQLWYEAGDKAGDVQNTIGYAKSGDGKSWGRASLPVMVPSSDLKVPLPFDSGDLEHPTAFVDESIAPNVEGHFLLWYSGDGEGGVSPNRIGLAQGALP